MLCFDYGHGGKDPGAVYLNRREADDNLRLGQRVAALLRQQGIQVDETRNADVTRELPARSSFANQKNYAYLVSFHRNAHQPERAKGAETFVHAKASPKARSLAARLQRVMTAQGFVDRGVKTANFHMLRATKAPAVLLEVGFVDSTADNRLFDARFEALAAGFAAAILAELGIVPKKVSYKVVAGVFGEKREAEAVVERLKGLGLLPRLEDV